MKRGMSWLMGLAVIASMIGAGLFALRHVLFPEPVSVYLFESVRPPTSNAMRLGAQAALDECRGRAGRFRVSLNDPTYAGRPFESDSPLWMGTSAEQGRVGSTEPAPFFVSVVDTDPWNPTGCLRATPGCDRQGHAAALWLQASKKRRVFLLRDGESSRSKAIADAFQTSAHSLDLTVAGPVDPEVPQLILVERILSFRPDAVFYSGEESPYQSAFTIFSELREKGYSGTLVMAEADPEVSFLATRPQLVEGTLLISPFAPPPPEFSKFAATSPGPHVTAGYLAMKAVLDALDLANSADPNELRRVIARIPRVDATGASTRPCALYVARKGRFEFVQNLP